MRVDVNRGAEQGLGQASDTVAHRLLHEQMSIVFCLNLRNHTAASSRHLWKYKKPVNIISQAAIHGNLNFASSISDVIHADLKKTQEVFPASRLFL